MEGNDNQAVTAAATATATIQPSSLSSSGNNKQGHNDNEDEIEVGLKSFEETIANNDKDEEVRVCVTAIPDERKGERLVVLHLPTKKCIDDMRKTLSELGMPNIFIPSRDCFCEISEIPILGTGKLDLRGAKERAAQELGVELG